MGGGCWFVLDCAFWWRCGGVAGLGCFGGVVILVLVWEFGAAVLVFFLFWDSWGWCLVWVFGFGWVGVLVG